MADFTDVFVLLYNRCHLSLSCEDCLADKTEDYQNCSVLCCILQLYAVINTHIWWYEQFLHVY